MGKFVIFLVLLINAVTSNISDNKVDSEGELEQEWSEDLAQEWSEMPEPPNEWPWNLMKDNPPQEHETFYDFFNRLTGGKIGNYSRQMHEFYEKSGRHHPPLDPSKIPKFDCPIPSNPKPATSVHRLRPSDIGIVGALGDSLTAAFGAKAYTLLDLFIEYRDISFSIGGEDTVEKYITLPNVIKKFNPKLIGFSTGDSTYGITYPSEQLNVAVSGSTNYDLKHQAERLVEKLVNGKKYDFYNTWKVVTLFIGGNDLCACCRKLEKYKPDKFIKGVREALDVLHENIPKILVNVITPPDVTILQDLSSTYCDIPHWIECKCGSVYGPVARNFTSHRRQEYTKLLQDLTSSDRYDTRDDFTVVLQPFFDETVIPRLPNGKVDRSYFAPDCFHFTWKAHAATALGLWNSMLEPVGHKRKKWEEGENFECPKEDFPYFFTNKNSKEYLARETITKDDSSVEEETKENEEQYWFVRMTKKQLTSYLKYLTGTKTEDEKKSRLFQHSLWWKNLNENYLDSSDINVKKGMAAVIVGLLLCFLMVLMMFFAITRSCIRSKPDWPGEFTKKNNDC